MAKKRRRTESGTETYRDTVAVRWMVGALMAMSVVVAALLYALQK